MKNELQELNKMSVDVARKRFDVLQSMNLYLRKYKMEICLQDITPDEMTNSNNVLDELTNASKTVFKLVYDENIMIGERDNPAVKYLDNGKLTLIIGWDDQSLGMKMLGGFEFPRFNLSNFENKVESLIFLFGGYR